MKSNDKNVHAFDLNLGMPESSLDLFAEELSDDALAGVAGGGNCFGTAGTFGSAGGTYGSLGTYGCLTKEQ